MTYRVIGFVTYLNSDHAYGALIFVSSSVKAYLCLLSSNNITVIEFKCSFVLIFVISAYFKPTIKNTDEDLLLFL